MVNIVKLSFLFEIMADHLIGYKGNETFRVKVNYEIHGNAAIQNVSIGALPFESILYLNNIKFAEDVWKAVKDHAAPLIEENKEFESLIEPEYNAIERQEKYLNGGD